MDHTAVDSSHIASVGYDREGKILEVTFKAGGVYQYHAVKPEEYAGLLAAQSKGRHLHQHFVQPGRAYTRVEEETSE